MEMNYCRRCGKVLTKIDDHTYKCENGHMVFANPSPTVGVFFVDDDNNVMLAVRGEEPGKGMSDSFGGFLNEGENFEDALRRELQEELGLEPNEYSELQYLTNGVSHYVWGGESKALVGVFYWSRLLTDRELTASDDVAAIRTVNINDIDLNDFSSEDNKQAIEKLRTILLS